MKNLKKLSTNEMSKVKGGGNVAWTLGWVFGNIFEAMCYAGEGLDRSGFNGAGANK